MACSSVRCHRPKGNLHSTGQLKIAYGTSHKRRAGETALKQSKRHCSSDGKKCRSQSSWDFRCKSVDRWGLCNKATLQIVADEQDLEPFSSEILNQVSVNL